MTSAAERMLNPGPGWRLATVYDRPLPDTYIKVVTAGTQAFWVLDGDRNLTTGDPVKFASAWGDEGFGTVRVAQPGRVLVSIPADETRGAFEQWFASTDVTRVVEE